MPTTTTTASSGRRVAIVSRMDEAATSAASTFVQQLGLEPVLVPASAGHGPADAMDLLDEARGSDYAIVLLAAESTGSDIVMEMGFLCGAVGRRRLCVLVAGKPNLGAEVDAIITARHTMDEAGLWRLLLAREMKQGGLEVDMNKAL